MNTGFTGISFPFRVGVKGGVAMSSTSTADITHVVESMEQILLTRNPERCMEYQIGSQVSTLIFDPNDKSTHTLIAYEVEKALSTLESRIKVMSVELESRESSIYANVVFKVLAYDTVYTKSIKVGDLDNVNTTDERDRLYL